jgi:hypothetical protein
VGLAEAVLVTEIGQILDLPRDRVFGFLRWRVSLNAPVEATAALVIYQQVRKQLFSRWMHTGFVVVVVSCRAGVGMLSTGKEGLPLFTGTPLVTPPVNAIAQSKLCPTNLQGNTPSPRLSDWNSRVKV